MDKGYILICTDVDGNYVDCHSQPELIIASTKEEAYEKAIAEIAENYDEVSQFFLIPSEGYSYKRAFTPAPWGFSSNES